MGRVTLGVYVRKALDLPEPADVYAVVKCADAEHHTGSCNGVRPVVHMPHIYSHTSF